MVRVRDNERTRYLACAFAAAVTLAACGGGSTAADTSRSQVATAPEQPAPPATGSGQQDYRNYYPPGTHRPSRAALLVITRWANELRAGHVRTAARYFDLPAVVQNATPPLQLRTQAEVVDFNRALPCGAHIVKTIAGARYIVATFVLTERPGSTACGATGELAATAFLLHDGKISEWRRVLVPPPLGPDQNLRGIDPSAV